MILLGLLPNLRIRKLSHFRSWEVTNSGHRRDTGHFRFEPGVRGAKQWPFSVLLPKLRA